MADGMVAPKAVHWVDSTAVGLVVQKDDCLEHDLVVQKVALLVACWGVKMAELWEILWVDSKVEGLAECSAVGWVASTAEHWDVH